MKPNDSKTYELFGLMHCDKRCKYLKPYKHPHWHRTAWCKWHKTELKAYDGQWMAACENKRLIK